MGAKRQEMLERQIRKDINEITKEEQDKPVQTVIHEGVTYKVDDVGSYSIGLSDIVFVGSLLACVYFTYELAAVAVVGWQMWVCLITIAFLGYALIGALAAMARKSEKGILKADLIPHMKTVS